MQTELGTENLFREYRNVDTLQREHLILKFAPLIQVIVNRIALRLPPHVDPKELINSGVIGLIDAMEKYDPLRGTSFKTYAEFRIRGAILDELRILDWFPRSIRQKVNRLEGAFTELERQLGRAATDEEVADALKINLDEFYEILAQASAVSLVSIHDIGKEEGEERSLLDCIASGEDGPAAALESQELYEAIGKAIERLPENERIVISLYYYDELTMREIGRILNLTESRVSQIHTKAILRLKARLRSLKDF
ncbi:MAG: FliA/WhiG family RNA polymerase sigma factor [Proteobacteria bacterium]|nr:FliA/WhiG family RNA polymerase sigma factor [Pseudomonadota bacterium]NIS68134.1 FliA/WhiG family RNA polymerase sigma factor [Pseudomonadota bacterium]